MKEKTVRKLDEGKRISPVTLMPSFFLGIKGRIDSFKNEKSVPDAEVTKMCAKCAAIEKKEALKAEKRSEKIRATAQAAAVALKRNYKKSDILPITSENGELSPYEIRENSRRASENGRKRTDINNSVRELIECAQALKHTETVLLERISKIRSKSFDIKVNAYIKGVRKGKLPDYAPEIKMDDSAFVIYKNMHKDSDELIFGMLEKIRKDEITV